MVCPSPAPTWRALTATALLLIGDRVGAQPPTTASGPATPVATPSVPAATQDSVDALFARWSAPTSPGCAVAASRSGRPLLGRAYGMANLDHGVPNTPATVFESGSVAKQFAAAALLLLVADGRLSLGDDVRKYVPELPDYGTVVTLDHLLTHTSGLREGHAVAFVGGWSPTSEADLLDVMARQRALNHRPGERFEYVGAGFFLASVIVKRVSGESLAAFSRRRMFAPLGMDATRWRENSRAVVSERATAYQPAGGGYLEAMPDEHVHGHGGLLTTVGDLLRWNDALESGRLGASVSTALHAVTRLPDGRPTGYGRGVYVGEHRGAREVFHDGGHGGYRAWLGRYPESGLSIALLCNTIVPDVTALARRVADVLLPPPAERPAPARAPASAPTTTAAVGMTAEEARRFAGVFLSDELGLPLVLTSDDVRLLVDGSPARRVAEHRFQAGGLDLLFETPDVLRLRKPSGERQTLRRIDARLPGPADLQAITGRYRSEEAVATYVVGVENDRLVLRLDGRPSYVHALTAIGHDVFRGSGMIVRVQRDATGRPGALVFSLSRVRELRFTRVSPP
jgi:CubicO group peptidase (beta-lactamase class C family)